MERSYAELYEPRRGPRIKRWLGKLGLWLWGAIGLGGIVAAYAGSVATEVLPAPRDLVCLAKEQFCRPAPGTQFTILISNLAEDPDGHQTRLVRDVFLNERGLEARSTCRVVRLDTASGSLTDAETAALERGRALLESRNADLLIWGEVKKADRELSLWFLSSGGSTLGAPSYSLSEKLTLPENFRADSAPSSKPSRWRRSPRATEQAGTHLVGLLKPARAKLEQLLASPPPEPDEEQKADLQFSLALAAQTIGEQPGENEPLEAAVDAYRAALEVRTRERVPLDWATTQNNLGNALSTRRARGRHAKARTGGRRLSRPPRGVPASRRELVRRHRRAQPRARRGAARRAPGKERGGVRGFFRFP
jgi:hypothetical protein